MKILIAKTIQTLSVALLIGGTMTIGHAATYYVSAGNPGAANPYDTWTTAAADIQTAVALAVGGDEVIVAPGTYDTGGHVHNGLTNRVFTGEDIILRSSNNIPETTIIKGAWHPGTTNGASAVRAVYLWGYNTQVIGFTITNGATLIGSGIGWNANQLCGGGVYSHRDSAVISNCIIAGNAACGWAYGAVGGGGVYRGTLYNCRIVGNYALGPDKAVGGGTDRSTLYDCELIGNVSESGAGAYRGTMYRCLFSNNLAKACTGPRGYGGGICGRNASEQAYAYDSTFVSNRADRGGGVSTWSVISNCLVYKNVTPITVGENGYGGGVYGDHNRTVAIDSMAISNTASHGGGFYAVYMTNCVAAHNDAVYGGGASKPNTLHNCLIYGNQGASYGGGGIYASYNTICRSSTIVGNEQDGLRLDGANTLIMENCIVYGNENNWDAGSGGGTILFTNSCTTPDVPGWDSSNTTNNPRFIADGSGYGVSHVAGDYRITSTSPCLNTGVNRPWMNTALDLDGNPRLDKTFGRVDMGCYERLISGSVVTVH